MPGARKNSAPTPTPLIPTYCPSTVTGIGTFVVRTESTPMFFGRLLSLPPPANADVRPMVRIIPITASQLYLFDRIFEFLSLLENAARVGGQFAADAIATFSPILLLF